jgi:cation:H+ antiporter
MFVALYAAYTLYLVLASTEHDSAQGFTIIMLWFILPLLAVTIITVTSYEVGLLKGRKERGNLKDARSG